MDHSRVLFLAICSNGKESGGERRYEFGGSFLSLLPQHSADLLRARRRVFQLIKSGTASRMGVPLSQFPHNDRLACGPDFGGEAPAEYLPSSARFRGRFYRELGPEGPELLMRSPHHVLILCGVYGLLTPAERIQAYNCYVEDHEEIGLTWRAREMLTSMLLSYIHRFDVSRVFDLTADPSFRSLLDWSRIREAARVLRAYGNENVGPDLLPSLGVLCRERLLKAPEEDLISIRNGERFPAGYEDVTVTSDDSPPKGFLGCPEPRIRSDMRSRETPLEGTVMLLDHPRDINVTAGEHNTMFDRRIQRMADLPPEARRIFEDASRVSDVLDVFLGKFSAGKAKGGFYLTLAAPKENMGKIFCKLRGPGRIGGIQEVEIRVTKGWEIRTYLKLSEFSWADRS